MLSRVGLQEAALYDDEPGDQRGSFDRVKKALQEALPKARDLASWPWSRGSGFLAERSWATSLAQDLRPMHSGTRSLTQAPVDILIRRHHRPILPLFLGLKGEAEESARAFAARS